MANKNTNLHQAKKAKCDEFYTQYSDIESELKHYTPQFEGKTVYCNCDNPDTSNFAKYFKDNFDTLKLKRLISTGYNAQWHGEALDFDAQGVVKKKLNGNGDFRSEECVELLKQADIVVTNPPFSLFREYVAQLVQYDKKFLIIGNQNAITYTEIFPLIKDGLLWLGTNGIKDMSFKVPSTYGERETRFWIDENGQHWRSLGNACWITNMENNKQNHAKCLINTYNDSKYPKYDNYNAINVDKVIEIPYNFEGVIGVPITALNYLCSDGLLHFEVPIKKKRTYRIIRFRHGNDNKDLSVNGKTPYFRILIQRVQDCRCKRLPQTRKTKVHYACQGCRQRNQWKANLRKNPHTTCIR